MTQPTLGWAACVRSSTFVWSMSAACISNQSWTGCRKSTDPFLQWPVTERNRLATSTWPHTTIFGVSFVRRINENARVNCTSKDMWTTQEGVGLQSVSQSPSANPVCAVFPPSRVCRETLRHWVAAVSSANDTVHRGPPVPGSNHHTIAQRLCNIAAQQRIALFVLCVRDCDFTLSALTNTNNKKKNTVPATLTLNKSV